VLTKTLITIGIFLSLFSYAYADYEVFDINPISPTDTIGITSGKWLMPGAVGNGYHTAFEYVGDATVTQFDRITIPFCRSGGSNTGEIYLELRNTATSGPIMASSSITVNSGNIASCDSVPTVPNATTTTFVLNQNVQYVSGVKIIFIFTLVNTHASSIFAFSTLLNTGDNGIFYGASAPGSPVPSTPYMPYGMPLYTSAIGYALGIPPVVYNASSSNVVCDTFDFGCYLSQSYAWAFYPDKEVIDQFKTLSLASTTPFGYAYAIPTLWNTFMVANAATTSTFGLTIDFSTLTGAGFQYVTATSVEVFNVCWVNDSRGELPQYAFRDLFLPYIRAFIWIALGFGLFLLAHKLW